MDIYLSGIDSRVCFQGLSHDVRVEDVGGECWGDLGARDLHCVQRAKNA